ncbi:MAG TPA: hypothetical protein VIH35_01880 [Kiritimatiellia bacterium]|jgi:hypothetical protein
MDDRADEVPRWFAPFSRLVPLLVPIGVAVVLLLIPLHVIKLGFLPSDDALRHVAKVVSGKSWQDIIVWRSGIEIDHNAGWHNFLGAIRGVTGWGSDGLVTFSVVFLCVLQLLVPLAFLRRAEAWAMALLAALVVHPHVIYRFCLGRPFVFVMTALMAILFLWLRHAPTRDRTPPKLVAATTLLMSLSIYVHGGWYLYWLPAAGFFLAQRWKQGFAMAGCWLAASLLAGLYTGHPVFFLGQQFQVLVSCFGQPVLQRMLVLEFQPFDGAWGFVVLAALVLMVQPSRGPLAAARNPAFMMAVACWAFGFVVRRFWTDWGTPALLVWLAVEIEAILDARVSRESINRVIATGVACFALYFAAASDHENRWTGNLTRGYLDADRADLEGWMPEPGGIVYNDDTRVFYFTFYRNPTAPWRYILGFEVTFMPAEDLAVLRRIQWNSRTPAAYEPWVRKMTAADRMILRQPGTSAPGVPGLEWNYAANDTWIGRLPRPASATP